MHSHSAAKILLFFPATYLISHFWKMAIHLHSLHTIEGLQVIISLVSLAVVF